MQNLWFGEWRYFISCAGHQNGGNLKAERSDVFWDYEEWGNHSDPKKDVFTHLDHCSPPWPPFWVRLIMGIKAGQQWEWMHWWSVEWLRGWNNYDHAIEYQWARRMVMYRLKSLEGLAASFAIVSYTRPWKETPMHLSLLFRVRTRFCNSLEYKGLQLFDILLKIPKRLT